MKHLIIAGTAAATLLATVSCSGSGSSGSSGRSGGPSGYLTVSKSNVAFIQWRATSNGHVHGTITESNTGGSAPAETLSVSSAPFIGYISGSSVTLTFAVLYFLQTSAHGTLSGSTLTLGVPQSDGTIHQATFTQSDEAGYDRSVAKLRSTVRHANLLVAGQQGQQPEQSAKGQAEQGAQAALSALYKSSSLEFNGPLARGETLLDKDIQIARSDLATEKKDASGSESYCVAAFRVAGAAQKVDGDLHAAQGAVQTVIPAVLTVRHDVAAANAHLRHLGKVGLQAPSSASGVIASAEGNLRQAIAKANSYIDQINAIDAQAHSIASNLATRRCSAARSGSSTLPISHIK